MQPVWRYSSAPPDWLQGRDGLFAVVAIPGDPAQPVFGLRFFEPRHLYRQGLSRARFIVAAGYSIVLI